MLRQSQQLRHDDLHNLDTFLRLAVLDDMLDNIVAILISDERQSALVYLLENASLIAGFTVLQYLLNDSGPIHMCTKNAHLSSKSFDDELDVLHRYSLDGFLHNVIAVLIFDTFEDIGLKFCNKLGLLIGEDMLESLSILVVGSRISWNLD